MVAATKERLHRLVESLPVREVHAAERFLEFLNGAATDPVLRALVDAPVDDEPEDDDERAAAEQARADVAAGRLVSHEEARRRLLGTG